MPQELDSNYPHVTPEEWATMEAPRDVLAARLVMSRHVTGIPRRGYRVGSADQAPVSKGVQELAEAAYALLDAVGVEIMDEGSAKAANALLDVLEKYDV